MNNCKKMDKKCEYADRLGMCENITATCARNRTMRLIDADELKRNHMFYHEVDNRSYAEERDIDETPTIDAVEVVHGEWINKYPLSTCSVCSATMILNDYSNYCPNCGAKMDGKEQSDEHV